MGLSNSKHLIKKLFFIEKLFIQAAKYIKVGWIYNPTQRQRHPLATHYNTRSYAFKIYLFERHNEREQVGGGAQEKENKQAPPHPAGRGAWGGACRGPARGAHPASGAGDWASAVGDRNKSQWLHPPRLLVVLLHSTSVAMGDSDQDFEVSQNDVRMGWTSPKKMVEKKSGRIQSTSNC